MCQRRFVSTSSSGFAVNSGLKWDQFYCGIGPGWTTGSAGCMDVIAGCVGGAGGCLGVVGSTTGCATGGGWGMGGPPSAILIYVWRGLSKFLTTLTKQK